MFKYHNTLSRDPLEHVSVNVAEDIMDNPRSITSIFSRIVTSSRLGPS